MAANNEIGVLQPIKEAAALGAREGRVVSHRRGAGRRQGAVRRRGARRGFRVDDGPQDLRAEGRRRVVCAPRRAGSVDARRRDRRRRPRARDALGHVERAGDCRIWAARRRLRARRWPAKRRASAALRDRLLAGLRAKTDGMTVNGAMDARLPGNLNVSFDGHRRRGVAGEPGRHRGVVGRGVHAGGTITCADGVGAVEGSRARVAAIRDWPSDDGGGRGLRGRKGSDVVARLRQMSPV